MRHLPGRGWAVLLGFALGGFFDGVLLHQVLQWHHLLSLMPGVGDLRAQVLWDGYFHALMYVLAVLGLAGLWRGRAGLPRGAALPGALLIGFGAWHAVDAVLSHWVLGIHRIRLDSAYPLAWDLLWLVLFGLLPMAAGWWLGRRGGGREGGPGPVVFASLAMLTAWAGSWAALPSGAATGAPTVSAVVFRGSMDAAAVLAALDGLDARLVAGDPAAGVLVLAMPARDGLRLYGRGAILVGGAGLPAGCLGWSRA